MKKEEEKKGAPAREERGAAEPAAAEDAGYAGEFDAENLWQVIVSLQGKTFYTSKRLPFSYAVKGGELFTDRRGRSVTRSTFERALEKIRADPAIRGPKKLNVYGAPYVWAILKTVGAVRPQEAEAEGQG